MSTINSTDSTDGISNSPTPPIPPPPPEGDLAYVDVLEFLEAANADNTCPVCRNTSWSVLNSQFLTDSYKEASIPLTAVNNQVSSTLSSYSVVLLTCNKCFYVRMHGRKSIHLWVKNGKKALDTDA